MAYHDDLAAFNRWRYPWHWAVNKFTEGKADWPHFMYDAMSMREESERLPRLFAAERQRALAKVHVQCSCCAPGEHPIEDNHLSCCLGVKCHACPYLIALDGADLTDEQRDHAKAWTCIAHIAASGPNVDTSEGMLFTVDDRMYWDRVYQNLAAGDAEVSDL